MSGTYASSDSKSYKDAYPIRDGKILMFLRSDVDLLVSQCRLNVRGIRGYIRNFTGCIRCGEAFATNLFVDLNYRVKHHMTLESPSFSISSPMNCCTMQKGLYPFTAAGCRNQCHCRVKCSCG